MAYIQWNTLVSKFKSQNTKGWIKESGLLISQWSLALIDWSGLNKGAGSEVTRVAPPNLPLPAYWLICNH